MNITPKIFLVCPEDNINQAVYNRLFEMLPLWRQEKALRLFTVSKRNISIVSGALFGYICNSLSINPREAQVDISPCGKPYLKSEDFYFNISHSGSYVACALAEAEIGIDIEALRTPPLQLVEKAFTPTEGEYISTACPHLQARRFFKIWTGKEALLKAMGCGLTYPVNSINLVENKEIKSRVFVPGEEKPYFLKQYMTDLWVISLSSKDPGALPLEIIPLSLRDLSKAIPHNPITRLL